MKLSLAACVLACAPLAAAQVPCIGGEYQQFKDRAATEDGLRLLARDFCANTIIGREKVGGCRDQMTKMRDAATAAGAGDAFETLTASLDACRGNADVLRAKGLIPR